MDAVKEKCRSVCPLDWLLIHRSLPIGPGLPHLHLRKGAPIHLSKRFRQYDFNQVRPLMLVRRPIFITKHLFGHAMNAYYLESLCHSSASRPSRSSRQPFVVRPAAYAAGSDTPSRCRTQRLAMLMPLRAAPMIPRNPWSVPMMYRPSMPVWPVRNLRGLP